MYIYIIYNSIMIYIYMIHITYHIFLRGCCSPEFEARSPKPGTRSPKLEIRHSEESQHVSPSPTRLADAAAQVYTHISSCPHTSLCVYIYVYIYIYTYMFICVFIYIHIIICQYICNTYNIGCHPPKSKIEARSPMPENCHSSSEESQNVSSSPMRLVGAAGQVYMYMHI